MLTTQNNADQNNDMAMAYDKETTSSCFSNTKRVKGSFKSKLITLVLSMLIISLETTCYEVFQKFPTNGGTEVDITDFANDVAQVESVTDSNLDNFTLIIIAQQIFVLTLSCTFATIWYKNHKASNRVNLLFFYLMAFLLCLQVPLTAYTVNSQNPDSLEQQMLRKTQQANNMLLYQVVYGACFGRSDQVAGIHSVITISLTMIFKTYLVQLILENKYTGIINFSFMLCSLVFILANFLVDYPPCGKTINKQGNFTDINDQRKRKIQRTPSMYSDQQNDMSEKACQQDLSSQKILSKKYQNRVDMSLDQDSRRVQDVENSVLMQNQSFQQQPSIQIGVNKMEQLFDSIATGVLIVVGREDKCSEVIYANSGILSMLGIGQAKSKEPRGVQVKQSPRISFKHHTTSQTELDLHSRMSTRIFHAYDKRKQSRNELNLRKLNLRQNKAQVFSLTEILEEFIYQRNSKDSIAKFGSFTPSSQQTIHLNSMSDKTNNKNQLQRLYFQLDIETGSPMVNYFNYHSSTSNNGLGIDYEDVSTQVTVSVCIEMVKLDLTPQELGSTKIFKKNNNCYMLLVRDIQTSLSEGQREPENVDTFTGCELALAHERVSQKCIRFLSMIEEQTLKSENLISQFTNKEMLVFDGKIDTRHSDLIVRDVNRSNTGLKVLEPSMRELIQLQKLQVKVWSTAHHLKVKLPAYCNLLKSMTSPSSLKLSFVQANSSLDRIIQKAIAPMRYQTQLKRIEIETILPTPDQNFWLEKFHCDWRIYKQILLCILENAIIFCNQNVTITVSFKKIIEKANQYQSGQNINKNLTGYLVTEVADDGSGMSQKVMENIFREQKNFAQNGLGLGTAKQLTQELGGNLYIQSTPEQGTNVTFIVTGIEKKMENISNFEEVFKSRMTRNEHLEPQKINPDYLQFSKQYENMMMHGQSEENFKFKLKSKLKPTEKIEPTRHQRSNQIIQIEPTPKEKKDVDQNFGRSFYMSEGSDEDQLNFKNDKENYGHFIKQSEQDEQRRNSSGAAEQMNQTTPITVVAQQQQTRDNNEKNKWFCIQESERNLTQECYQENRKSKNNTDFGGLTGFELGSLNDDGGGNEAHISDAAKTYEIEAQLQQIDQRMPSPNRTNFLPQNRI